MDNVTIETNDLTFIENNKVKKYLMSDYFNKNINNNEVNVKDKVSIRDTITSIERVVLKEHIIKTIKRKNNIQQHILKKPKENDTWGASMDTHNQDSIRIYFQNINGLLMGTKEERWTEHLDNMKKAGCDIFGLAEPNTNWNSKNIRKIINIIANEKFNNITTNLSENRFQPNSKSSFLPGGTLQSCCNHWTGRILQHYTDPRKLGRWTGHQYRLKENKTLSVITAYRTCYQSLTNLKLESRTASNQQVILLQEDGIINPNPREIFVEDMIKVLNDIEKSEDNYILLMFDANEDINDREKGLRKIIEKTSLVDSFCGSIRK